MSSIVTTDSAACIQSYVVDTCLGWILLLGQVIMRSKSRCSFYGLASGGEMYSTGGQRLLREARNGEERSLLPNQLLQLYVLANGHQLSRQEPKAPESQVQGQPKVYVSSRSV